MGYRPVFAVDSATMPLRTITLATAAAALLAMAGCASVTGRAGPNGLSAADRGHDFAQRTCAQCHAIGRTEDSPRVDAPSFASIRMRYNSLSLERELASIADRGHFRMPAVSTWESDRRDLIAYIETLGG